MGSQNNTCYLINSSNPSDLSVHKVFPHPHQVFGVTWNSSGDIFATGCLDSKVRVFNKEQSSPIQIFEGHEKRVFNVVFSPIVPNILASGSDDLTIRVWDTNGDSVKVLQGHTANVRAIVFNPELPWCLVSGSWDHTIKLWDTRSG